MIFYMSHLAEYFFPFIRPLFHKRSTNQVLKMLGVLVKRKEWSGKSQFLVVNVTLGVPLRLRRGFLDS